MLFFVNAPAIARAAPIAAPNINPINVIASPMGLFIMNREGSSILALPGKRLAGLTCEGLSEHDP